MTKFELAHLQVRRCCKYMDWKAWNFFMDLMEKYGWEKYCREEDQQA